MRLGIDSGDLEIMGAGKATLLPAFSENGLMQIEYTNIKECFVLDCELLMHAGETRLTEPLLPEPPLHTGWRGRFTDTGLKRVLQS